MLNQQEAGSVQQDPAAPSGNYSHKWLPGFAVPNMTQLQSDFQTSSNLHTTMENVTS